MRIASFLPAATEIAFALGLGDSVVGVSHECDWPAEARRKPVLVMPVLDTARMPPSEVNTAVGGRVATKLPLYEVDLPLLRSLAPDLILAQELCDVCATPWSAVIAAVKEAAPSARVVNLSPQRLGQVLEDFRRVGEAAGAMASAEALLLRIRGRISDIRARAQSGSLYKVACIEWSDPLMCAGHWVPEMVRYAGGVDVLNNEGQPSKRIEWDEVVKAAPQVILLMPCGYDAKRALTEVPLLAARPGWKDLSAVKHGRVWAVDANAYFSRPGPRLVEGLEILGQILHTERGPWRAPAGSFLRWEG